MSDLYFEYAKSQNNKTVMTMKEFKGKRYLDIREKFFDGTNWHYTKKGVSIPLEEMEQLSKDLEELKRNSA
ncbi:transcriptional coactivator protein [Rhizobium phage RHph_TM30]|uniref:Transcriptional coactivator protein n=1 Tax=Rhizobium phage RHph_TM30 TaxID=2509764 RepID=A0A7S5RAY5_9CAUD|nr:transcriptional coactivator protein [Rhizobium phage RHph_TM30]QIG71290.1 transcriptional coactivator protein [Rhizobium phage RHph_TM30]